MEMLNDNIEELKKQQLKVLEDTCRAYSIDTRCTFNEGSLYYHKGHQGCAIGRLIENKDLCKELDDIGCVSEQNAFEKLPDDVKKLGKGFLSLLQQLHDNEEYWNKEGLSQEGEFFVADIVAFIESYK